MTEKAMCVTKAAIAGAVFGSAVGMVFGRKQIADAVDFWFPALLFISYDAISGMEKENSIMGCKNRK